MKHTLEKQNAANNLAFTIMSWLVLNLGVNLFLALDIGNYFNLWRVFSHEAEK